MSSRQEGEEMSFLEHLDELRKHIIRVLAAVVLTGSIFFVFHRWVFEKIIFAPINPDFISYKLMCRVSEIICFSPPQFSQQAIGFAESFIISIKASFVLGFIACFPYIFHEFWQFIRPGLHENEQRATRSVVAICSFLFLTGVSFGYFIIAPFAINFLMGFTIPGVENTPTLSSFLNYMVMFTAPAGLIFELPIVVYFLSKAGLVTPAFMRQYRRHAFIGILILAAVVTPPDVVTQFLIGVPLYILYELSIFISARVERDMKRRDAERYGN